MFSSAHLLLLLSAATGTAGAPLDLVPAPVIASPDRFAVVERTLAPVIAPSNVTVTDIYATHAVARWTRGENGVQTFVQVNHGSGWVSMFYPTGYDVDSLHLWDFLERARTYDIRVWHRKSGGVLFSDTVTVYNAFSTPAAPTADGYFYEISCGDIYTDEETDITYATHIITWLANDARTSGWTWELYADDGSGLSLIDTGAQGTNLTYVVYPVTGTPADAYIRYVKSGQPDGEMRLMPNGGSHLGTCGMDQPRPKARAVTSLLRHPADLLTRALGH